MMVSFKSFISLSCLLLLISSSLSQTIIQGQVRDLESKKPLAAANIQILDTYNGTISNEEGRFVLMLDSLPSQILITYIGYESKYVTISTVSRRMINIELIPIIFESDPIVVIAEDPAMEIMRKVIRNKQKWYPNLKTFRANAYSRLILENDSGIVSISESLSDTFWDHQKGSREVIKSKQQTNNLSEEQNLAFATFIPNFYDDDISIVGFSVPGPTHPDAFDFYKFKLVQTRRMDKNAVYDISVIPDTKLQPAFTGIISVMDEKFCVLEVDLIPGESIRFPMPIQQLNLHYRQQFREYDERYWLPVDFRLEGNIKIGMTGLNFPQILYKRITALSHYEINVALPDSLYDTKTFISVDSLSIQSDSLFATTPLKVPLTQKEETAYTSLDSSMTLKKAFKPTGFLANLLEMSSDDSDDKSSGAKSIFTYFSPQFWFNRVDAFHLGITFKYDLPYNMHFRLGAGYKTGQKRWSYHTSLAYDSDNKSAIYGKIHYYQNTDSRYKSNTYSFTLASLPPLLGKPDYFDYYWQDGFSIKIGTKIKVLQTKISAIFFTEKHSSLNKNTDYNLLGSSFKQRENPEIDEGVMRGLKFIIHYGGDYIPFGVVGQKRFRFQIEISQPSLIASNYSFTSYQLDIDWRIKTFLTRRLLPNALDIRFDAGHTRGNTPIQRYGIVDARFDYFTPFAVLKTLRNLPYEGESYLNLSWEHNFRTVPFELINLNFAVNNGIGIIIFGFHARTWITGESLDNLNYHPQYRNDFHHEIGISLNNLFSLIRLDFAYRLDNRAAYMGFSLARFF